MMFSLVIINCKNKKIVKKADLGKNSNSLKIYLQGLALQFYTKV